MSMKLRLQAWGDLWRHYGRVFRHAWESRLETDTKALHAHERDFLPAALALQETPVSPAPRIAMWLIIAFALLALVWACLGKIDVVAVAPGKIVPNDRSKVVQSFAVSTVKAIHVRDGQHVKAGDVLIELDGTETEADRLRIANDLAAARLQAARARAMLKALDTGAMPVMERPKDIPDMLWQESQRLLSGQFAEYRSKLSLLDADIAQKKAQLASTGEQVHKLERTLPIVQERARTVKSMSDQDNAPKDLFLEREQARLETESDLATNRSRIGEINAALAQSNEQKSALLAETRRTQLDSLNEGLQKAGELEQEQVKAQSRSELMKLTAPVDGTVQQLAVHTVGGVVTEAQALMVIVPTEDSLEVEAMVDNQDIGFVNAGQDAQIKVQTFLYTKYGFIHGKVISVSTDAINDEKKGLIYSARVKMDRSTMQVEGKTVRLSPGMAVSVEIKTGTRRLIEFFLNPLLQMKSEGLRER